MSDPSADQGLRLGSGWDYRRGGAFESTFVERLRYLWTLRTQQLTSAIESKPESSLENLYIQRTHR